MKKWLLVLGMLTCILGVSACGNEETEYVRTDITQEEAVSAGGHVVDTLIMFCSDEYKDYRAQVEKESPVYAAALKIWEDAQADMGSYVGILETTADLNEDGVIINVKLDGSERDATLEIILDDDLMETSITTNVEYAFGELMQKAALNTVLGMGTVFAVLILICLIISCFAPISFLHLFFIMKTCQRQTYRRFGAFYRNLAECCLIPAKFIFQTADRSILVNIYCFNAHSLCPVAHLLGA